MIITQLLGGMGNQMFQYAIAKHLAILNNTTLKVDTSILLDWSKGRHAVNRSYDLDIFKLQVETASRQEIARYNSQLMSMPEKVVFKIQNRIFKSQVTKEQFFHYNQDILDLRSKVIYLTGTWQSYKYFEKIENIIRTDFTFRDKLTGEVEGIVDQMNKQISVCLHVRRTDYINVKASSDIMATVSLDYYKQAVEYIQKEINEFKVFVFSDDLEWCRQNLQFIQQPIVFVKYKGQGESLWTRFAVNDSV